MQQRLNDQEDPKLTQELKTQFPGSKIAAPSATTKAESQTAPKELVFIAIVYFVSMLSFMFLMKFMVDANSAENIIYSLVGASRKKVVSILVLENVILTAITGVFSIALHMALRTTLFEKINTMANIQYDWTDYAIILAALLILSAVTTLPFIRGYYKNTLIQSKNNYVMGE